MTNFINRFRSIINNYRSEKGMSQLEKVIFNKGERLIPGVTHDVKEVIRHKSSYLFFKRVIEIDRSIDRSIPDKQYDLIRVVDLGCGVGHGCYELAQIDDSQIIGVDMSSESLEYAKNKYSQNNIRYRNIDIIEFINTMTTYDYVVSRGVLEHIENGITNAFSSKYEKRLMFDVPYDEPDEANPHHIICNITEENFYNYHDIELFYQDLSGVIYDKNSKPEHPNMIIAIQTRGKLKRVSELGINFPLGPWNPNIPSEPLESLDNKSL
jgi:SAM-dependent methyltransferase